MILNEGFSIFDYIPDAVYYKDTNNKIMKVNDYYFKIVGKPKNEIENCYAHEIYPKELAQKYWKYDQEVIMSKQAKIDIEEEWNTKFGKRNVLCSRIPIKDKEGDVIGILGIAKDIHERKITERKLRESEEQFRTMAEQSIMGICIIQDDQIKYLNETLTEILGYTSEEIRNWDLVDMRSIIHTDDQSLVMDQLFKKQMGEEEVVDNYQFRILKKNGNIAWVEIYSKSIPYKGKIADLIMVVDITESREAQEKLISLNKLRSELLSRTSHELKTPLVMIKGYTELLREKNKAILPKEALEMLDIIDEGVVNLKNLIEQIMNASRVKAKKLKINKTTNNLSHIINAAVKEMEGMRKLRNHEIRLNIDDDIMLELDRDGIFQVIKNIISNAIKFTPRNGNIIMQTQLTESEVIISVQDNGIGFEGNEKAYLFSEFGKIERFGEDVDVIVKGSGLGLYISKNIVELHGGRIWMESKGRNKGSTFYFSLPFEFKAPSI